MFRRYFLDDVFEGGLIVGGQIEFPTFDTVKSTTQIPLPPTFGTQAYGKWRTGSHYR